MGYGVGTAWYSGARGEEATIAAVEAALDAGFRHVDEAELYNNEVATGKGIARWLARSGAPRSDVFVTSKVLPSIDEPGGVLAGCRRSLERMGLAYFDLYLVHAPFRRGDGAPLSKPLPDVWRDMEALVDAGLARSIGVSNWRVCDLEEVLGGCRLRPAVNQVEAHPLLQQHVLLSYCERVGVAVARYGPLVPLANASVRDTPGGRAVASAAEGVAKARGGGMTAAQVLLAWSSRGGRFVTITTTSQPQRMTESLAAPSVLLSDEEAGAIAAAGAAHPTARAFWTKESARVAWDDPR